MAENDEREQMVDERRRQERTPFSGDVVVGFDGLEIVGPGRNISEAGVYFVSDTTPRIKVSVDGREREGELIRISSLGDGQIGVAVRFLDRD